MAGETPWTAGPWTLPHFVRDDHGCNCGYVFSDAQAGMGAIATVHYEGDKADPQEPCGHQNEPLEKAKANARLIAAAPEMAVEIADNLDTLEKLRADLIETDAEDHAQRIAVLDIHIERQRPILAKIGGAA